jgi:hypothetical protein
MPDFRRPHRPPVRYSDARTGSVETVRARSVDADNATNAESEDDRRVSYVTARDYGLTPISFAVQLASKEEKAT